MAFNQKLASRQSNGILIGPVSTINGVPGCQPVFSSDSTNAEFQGTDWAILITRMTTTQRNALTDPVNGMLIYNTTLGKTQAYEGGTWVTLSNSSGGTFVADAGTAAAPSYSFTGDTNTGIYSSGADTLDFTAGGFRQAEIAFTNNAVNYLRFTGGVTGGVPYFTNGVTISSQGTDTHIGLNLLAKGLAAVNINGDTNNGAVRFWNAANTFYTGITCSNPASNTDYQLPDDYPSLSGVPILVSTTGEMSFDPDGAILHTRVLVPTASVKTMFTAGIQLLAPPGATKGYMVHKAMFTVKYATTTYTGGGAIGLTYSVSNAAALDSTVDAALLVGPTVSTTESVTGLIGQDQLSQILNNGILVTCATANFATGDSPLYIDLWYSLVTAP